MFDNTPANARALANDYRHIHYSVAVSIAYGLDGMYGHPKADAMRDLLEPAVARFTPGMPPYGERGLVVMVRGRDVRPAPADEPGAYWTQASDLGLYPGEWPDTLYAKVDGRSTRLYRRAWSGTDDDVQAVTYDNGGSVALQVLND